MTGPHGDRGVHATPTDAKGAPAQDRPLTVGELARRVVRLLESDIGTVHVAGEVSNLRSPQSGHCYFLLKDSEAAVNAVCFRGTVTRQNFKLADGAKIEVRGRMTAYPPRSEYQIIVESMREAGSGDLMRRLLELKDKLKAEGLFESSRKRTIPRLPRAIGIVTSPTGAALRDMLHVLRRRARGLSIYVSPAAVQGDAAPLEIIRALELLALHNKVEVIIVGRGGGSLEDLWAFNDERVVRALAASPIPVISAVGHETDTTLVDYASDLRAPTPSAAAELVSAHHDEITMQVEQWQRRLSRAMGSALSQRRARLERCQNSWGLRSPTERLARTVQRLDDLRQQVEQATLRGIARRRTTLEAWSGRLERAHPRKTAALQANKLQAASQMRGQLQARLTQAISGHLRGAQLEFGALQQRLTTANPEAILQRGYSIVTKGQAQKIVTRPEQVRVNETVQIRSAGGTWRAAAISNEPDLFEGAT